MRISGGFLQGKMINTLSDGQIRPMTDRTKLAIFNMLAGRINGADIVDLYAGTGALAIESISRGAAQAVLVEKNKNTVDLLKKNLIKLDIAGQAKVVNISVESFLASQNEKLFDIVYFDPPYADFSLDLVGRAANILQPNGLLVTSSSSNQILPQELLHLELVRDKVYGDTRVGIYRKT